MFLYIFITTCVKNVLKASHFVHVGTHYVSSESNGFTQGFLCRDGYTKWKRRTHVCFTCQFNRKNTLEIHAKIEVIDDNNDLHHLDFSHCVKLLVIVFGVFSFLFGKLKTNKQTNKHKNKNKKHLGQKKSLTIQCSLKRQCSIIIT